MTSPLLQVDDLVVSTATEGVRTTILDGVHLAVDGGQTVALVGESGSGKTMTARSILGLLPRSCRIDGGSIRLLGSELVDSDGQSNIGAARGRDISVVFQNGARSLHPAMRIGDQIARLAHLHLGLGWSDAMARAVELLGDVGIADPERRAKSYPHQFSGGMCQRVAIAMAVICRPKVLIADEPTSALDVSTQVQVLRLLKALQDAMGLAIVYVSHDLGTVAEFADRVSVMYAGQIVEEGDVLAVFREPQHPYTAALLGSIPQAHSGGWFRSIGGTVPRPGSWAEGCRFGPRCSHFTAGLCDAGPPELRDTGEGLSRCVKVLPLAGIPE